MIELEYLGRSGDARSVILTDAEGQRYSVVVTDELRTAVRRDPLLNESPNTVDPTPRVLRPSHIQAMLREGLSASEIAASQGVPLESITRYESPVLAEKAWAINRAQQTPVTPEAGAPNLEDLVINRLAARGVDHHSLVWDALRRPGEDWEVSLTFIQSAVEKTATWKLLRGGTQVAALDQEANWLTETASPLAPVSAFFSPVSSPGSASASSVFDVMESDSGTDQDIRLAQEELVDQANSQRGRRQPILDDVSNEALEEGDDFPFFSGRVLHFENRIPPEAPDSGDTAPLAIAPVETGSDNDSATQAPLEMKRRAPGAPVAVPANVSANAAPSASAATTSDTLFAAPVVEDKPEPPREKKRTGSKRRPVPSWDEIVFGSRPD